MELYSRFESAGIQIVGVSTDKLVTQTRFADSLSLPFPLVADGDKSVCRAYGTLNKLRRGATRQTFAISQEGRILYHNPTVKPREMPAYRDLLDELGAESEGV